MDPKLMNALFGLTGRTVLITGACGGLGTELTKALLQAGADVVCTDFMASAPETTQWRSLQTLAESQDRRLSYCSMDVTAEKAIAEAFGTVELRYPIRGLVCCAGISERGPSVEFPASSVRTIMDINVTGTFLCARWAAKYFRKKGVEGSIVLIASMSGFVSNRGVDTAAYNASKAAIHQLARSFACEWGKLEHPIRVNTISPGYILTDATGPTMRELPHLQALWPAGSVLGRLSQPQEFRAPVLFLLGDGSSYMTGADLRVDGEFPTAPAALAMHQRVSCR